MALNEGEWLNNEPPKGFTSNEFCWAKNVPEATKNKKK